MKDIHKLIITLSVGVAIGATIVEALHAQSRPPVYVVGEIEVTDQATYNIYSSGQSALVPSFGGQFLARGGKTESIAGAPPRPRAVLIKFENMEKVRAWRDSPKFKELAVPRDKGANFRAYAIEGVN
jgi:uncharacterized protein (DUF1330 family)